MKRSLSVLAALALAAPLAACGGDDGGGGSAAEWCSYGEDLREREAAFESVDFMDPERLRTALEEVRSVIDEAAEVAPSEIRSDVQASRDGFNAFYDELEDVDFSVFEADPAALEDLGEGLEEANERIDAYNSEVCGFTDEEPTPADDSVDEIDDTIDEEGSAGTLPDVSTAIGDLEELTELMGDEGIEEILADDSVAQLFVQQLVTEFENQGFTPDEAQCMAEAYDLEEILSGNFDPMDEAGTFVIFEECGISAQRLAEVGG